MFTSCVSEDLGNCGVWLEFIFDRNMEYADSFRPQVGSVDVLLFDGSGRYLLKCHASASELVDRNRLFLGGELPPGNYKILTVGVASEHFGFTAFDGGDLVPGVTAVDRVKLWLRHDGAFSREFGSLWFSPTVDFHYCADLSVVQVPLVRETNRFNITLQRIMIGSGQMPVRAYTAEIVAPEAGAYDFANEPVTPEPMVYRPYRRESRLDSKGVEYLTILNLNTMRLLSAAAGGYRLVVRDAKTGDQLWIFNLLELLGCTKPDLRPDGTPLPMQEYFDRRGEWNVVILHGCGPNDGFAALDVIINGRIVREHGAGI